MERNQPYEPRTGAWRHLYVSIAWDGGAVAVSATSPGLRRARSQLASEKSGSDLVFPWLAQADIVPMTSHVECVAILEPAEKGR